jgi:RecB family endonuclease NucS
MLKGIGKGSSRCGVSRAERENLPTELERTLQAFLDADGFFIVAGRKERKIGDVIDHVVRAATGEVFPYKLVVRGKSSREEAVRQLERYGLSYRQRYEYLYFYKVIAE